MKEKLIALLVAVALLAVLLLAGILYNCKQNSPGTGTGSTEESTNSVPGTDGSSAEGGESASGTNPATAPGAESDTKPSEETLDPALVEVPTECPANLMPFLRGEAASYDLRYDFTGKTLEALRADNTLYFSQGDVMQAGESGLYVPKSSWAAVGFSRTMSAPCTISARLRADRDVITPGDASAVMLGVRLTNVGHTFTDSGLWVILRNDEAYISIGGSGAAYFLTMDEPITVDTETDLRVEDKGDVLRVLANERVLVTANFTDTEVHLLDGNGKTITSMGLTHLAHGVTLGYTRVMSHNIDGYLIKLEAIAQVSASYLPTEGLVAIKAGRDYLFRDEQQYRAASPAVRVRNHYFTDAQALAELFGFMYTQEGDTVTLSRSLLELTFRVGETGVSINGEEAPFPTVLRQGGTTLLCADWLAEMLGYVIRCGTDTLYLFPDNIQDVNKQIEEMDKRF